MATIISSKTSGVGGLTVTGDASGVLQLASANGTTAVTIDASQNVTFAKAINKAALPTGSVLQVVNATYSTPVSNSTSTFVDTGLTATITPLFSTSKILVTVHQEGVGKTASDTAVIISLVRNTTGIVTFSLFAGQTSSAATSTIGGCGTTFLDTPTTTSAVIYKTQFNSYSNTNGVGVQRSNEMSTITLMEIAG